MKYVILATVSDRQRPSATVVITRSYSIDSWGATVSDRATVVHHDCQKSDVAEMCKMTKISKIRCFRKCVDQWVEGVCKK